MHAYRITDTEGDVFYYAARNESDAIEAHNRDWSPEASTAELIPDDQLDTLTLVVQDENELPTDETMTFREFMDDNADEQEAYQIGDSL